jgi:hypothetical protein
MAMQQGTLVQERAGRFVTHLGAQFVGTVFSVAVKAPVRLTMRALIGSRSGPRGYPREEFPEAQWQQILAGRRNWFS